MKKQKKWGKGQGWERWTHLTRPDGQKRRRWFPVWDFWINIEVKLSSPDVESWSDRSLSLWAVCYVLLSLSFSPWIPYLSCATAACDCSGAHWSPLWLVIIMEIICNGVEDCESEEIGRDGSNAFLLLVTVSHVVDVTTCRDAAWI